MRAGALAAGEFTRGAEGREYCDREVLRQIRRQTLAILRTQAEPVEGAAYARFLLHRHGLAPLDRSGGGGPPWGVSPEGVPPGGVSPGGVSPGGVSPGGVSPEGVPPGGVSPRGVSPGGVPPGYAPDGPAPDRLLRALRRLQGIPLPAGLWEREILPRRVPGYQPLWLDQLLAAGELHWAGAPGGRVAFYLPDEVPLFADRLTASPPEPLTPAQAQVLAACQSAGAAFLGHIARLAGLTPAETLEALWALVWMGLVTNDTFAPVREVLRPGRAARRPGRPAPRLRGGTGRWWPTAALAETGTADPAEIYARLLLDRYGVVARETVAADEGPLSWGEVLPCLRRMEWRGEVRQGYFVAGLTGVQFARADAVEQLRRARDLTGAPPLLLNAADPANPYGTVLPWPEGERLARLAANYLVMVDGRPVLGVERYGRRLVPLAPVPEEQLGPVLAVLPGLLKAPAAARPVRRIEVHQWADMPVQQSPAAGPLRALGFEPAPRGLVYYG